jgi:hypothetical protein
MLIFYLNLYLLYLLDWIHFLLVIIILLLVQPENEKPIIESRDEISYEEAKPESPIFLVQFTSLTFSLRFAPDVTPHQQNQH